MLYFSVNKQTNKQKKTKGNKGIRNANEKEKEGERVAYVFCRTGVTSRLRKS